MNKIAMIGTTLLALGLGMGMSGQAHSFSGPPHACTAQNQGELYFEQIGPYRYDQPYTIIQYECYSNGWVATERFICDYYTAGCIQM
jgi:hypothetical protein